MVPMPLIDVPFKWVATGIVGQVEKNAARYQYILIRLNYATWYPEAIPLKSMLALQVAEVTLCILSSGIAKRNII